MIDLHSHILPGLDDGARDLTDAVAMARAAVAAGVRTVVATPHAFGARMDVSSQDRDHGLEALRAELVRLAVPLAVVPGFECQVVDGLAAVLAAQPAYLYPTLAGTAGAPGSRHVLIELDEERPLNCLDAVLFGLQTIRVTRF